ncbi:MAG: YihY/virulence factor BrkB family protein [Myxococcota bacterium]
MAERMGSGDPPSDRSNGGGLLARWRVLEARFVRELWSHDPGERLLLRVGRSTLQLIALTARGFQSDNLLLRASALTYVTALSIIPMLAVVIAILDLVGGNESLVDFVIDQLTTVAPEVRETVRTYAAGLDFARFGTVGGTILFATAVFALRHLERTLNDIWGVASSRSWPRRFADYLAVMVVAPISTGVAVSLGTTLQSATVTTRLLEHPVFAKVYGMGLSQVPVVVLFAGFTFLYWFFPNTTVRVRAAALGGVVAAVLFSAARSIYVDFQIGAATYQAVFGALSAVPLILAWLYACWAILLLGAEVAFAAQNLLARREMRRGETTPAHREAVALEIAVAIARRFLRGEEPPTAEALADELDEPVRLVRRSLDALEIAGVVLPVVPREDKDAGLVPAAPLERLSVAQVLRAVRGIVEPGSADPPGPRTAGVTRTLERLEAAWADVADETSLAELAVDPVRDAAPRAMHAAAPDPHEAAD